MKKYIIRGAAAVLGAGLLLTGAMAWGKGDSLISLSYLTQHFIPETVEQGDEIHAEKMEQAYDEAMQQLTGVQPGETEPVSGTGLGRVQYSRMEQIVLEEGAGFLMQLGQAGISHNGTVIDVTAGQTLQGNDVLQPGHRYLVGKNTTALIIVRSGLVYGGAQGSVSVLGTGERSAPFIDVTGDDWYCTAVDYAYFNNLFSGMGDDKFAPMSSMDRAMMMTVLYHLAGDPEEERLAATASFTDVPADKWYHTFVSWAAEQGVSAGTGEGAFSPTQAVTREQVIVLLYNFACNYMGMTLPERTDLSGYADIDRVAFWSADAMSWAAASGVLTVVQDNMLEPSRAATRAEVASMLMNFSRRYLE